MIQHLTLDQFANESTARRSPRLALVVCCAARDHAQRTQKRALYIGQEATMTPVTRRWPIAAAGVVMQIALGAVYAWSVFRIPLTQAFGWTIPR